MEHCQQYLSHRIQGRSQTVGKDFEIVKTALLQLPGYVFDSSRQVLATVDYYATVKFGRNRYSVPVQLTGKQVTVKGYGLAVQICFHNQTVATHERCYGKDETRFQLSHYIRLLEQRPRTLYNAKPVKQANLPQELWEWASRLLFYLNLWKPESHQNEKDLPVRTVDLSLCDHLIGGESA